MPLDRLDFENPQENDLIELLNAQVPEGLYLDYKRDMYGNTNDGKQELLKDVSAFANAHGGHLIIGMDEQGGIPIAIDGIATADPDQLILWLEQLMRDGIEPRMPGVRSVPVRLTSGSYCFVVRVPRSWNPPHRIRLRNVNRFHIRNSTGIHEASTAFRKSLISYAACLR
jgi:predicted HTH transcriptional regulator